MYYDKKAERPEFMAEERDADPRRTGLGHRINQPVDESGKDIPNPSDPNNYGYNMRSGELDAQPVDDASMPTSTEPFVDADESNSPRDSMMRFFEYAQYPEPLRSTCRSFHTLAE